MLKYNIIIIVALLIGGLDCDAAVRGAYVRQPVGVRRNQNAVFMRSQARTSQSVNTNNFVPVQQIDEFVVSDMEPDIPAPDDIIDEMEVSQESVESESQEPLFTDEELSEIISSLTEIVKVLDSEIDTLNAEIARCKREKKTSTILTVVGVAGTLGSGIGAAIQGKKLHDAKKSGATEKQDKQDAAE